MKINKKVSLLFMIVASCNFTMTEQQPSENRSNIPYPVSVETAPHPECDRIVSLLNELNTKAKEKGIETLGSEERTKWVHSNLEPLRKYIKSCSLETIQKSKDPITGSTLLMLAMQLRDIELINIILAKGVDVNEKNYFGSSAIILTASIDSYEFFTSVVTLLLKHGADINDTDSQGNTLAHGIACMSIYENHLYEFKKMSAFLNQHGADFTLKNRKGVSAQDISIMIDLSLPLHQGEE